MDGQQDGRNRRVRRRLLVVDGPLPHERAGELSVLDQRRAVGAEPRRRDRAGLRRRVVVRARPNRDERLAQALVLRAQVGLGIVLERGGLAVGHAGGAGRGRGHAEQRADHVLGVVVVAFAEVRVADVALAIGDVVGGPVLVAEGVPDVHLVVDGDRPRHVVALDRVDDVGADVLEVELGRVDADDDEPGGPVAVVPRPDVRERTLAVDARVRPEVVEHDLAAQLRRGDRRRVDPPVGLDLRRGAQYREVRRIDRTRDLLWIGVGADDHGEHRDRDQHHCGDQIASPPTGTATALPRRRTCGCHGCECTSGYSRHGVASRMRSGGRSVPDET